MSNVTPIRLDTCQEYPRVDAELHSTRRERDTLKLRVVELESEMRHTRRLMEKATQHARDAGRIQGMVVCSCFVAIGLAIASVWAI